MRIIRYLFAVLDFAIQSSRWARAVLLLAVLGILLEFAALSVLIPLTQYINHSHMSAVARDWNLVLTWAGVLPDAKTWFELFLGLILVRVLLQFAYSALTSSVSRDVTALLASGAFRRFIVETSLLEIQRHKIGHFIAIAGDEASRAGQIFLYFTQLLAASLSVLVTIAAMLVFSFDLAIGVAVFVVITGFTILRSTRHVYRMGTVIKAESRVATSTFLDGLNGLRSVRSVGGGAYVVNQYTDQVKKYHRTLARVDFTTHAQKNLPLIILLLLVLAAIASLSPAAIAHVDMASTLAGMILLMRFFPSAGACLNNGMKLLADLRAAHDVVSAATAPERRRTEEQQPSSGPIRQIEVRELSYRYEGAPHAVLSGLSHTFNAGCSYAICGPSGSGKSTLVDLILGLIPVESTSIRVNGVPLIEINQQEYRKRVVLVEQQSRIFNDTVRNNIVFGLAASEQEIRNVVRLAGLEPVLGAMPLGLDTVLDYQGTNLSGGQRQRLGIARALLRDPDVVVLDESTSALDEPTRNLVLGNILRHFRDRIIIVVTHDPAVISRMQRTLHLRTHGSPAAPSADAEALDPDRDELRTNWVDSVDGTTTE
jgi:ABC-type multidrug transport system fused ATPase/permease subunit